MTECFLEHYELVKETAEKTQHALQQAARPKKEAKDLFSSKIVLVKTCCIQFGCKGYKRKEQTIGLGLSVYRFIGLSVYRFIGVSDYRFIGLSVYRFVGLSVCRFIGLSVYRFIGLSVYRFIGLSVYRFIGLSVYRFIGIGLSVYRLTRIGFNLIGIGNLYICFVHTLQDPGFAKLANLRQVVHELSQ